MSDKKEIKQTAENTVTPENNKAAAAAETKPAEKKAKKVVKKDKKPNFFVRMGKKIKEIFSELKKVTWPTFPTVIKSTGVVIAVVAFFLVIIFLFDFGLSFLYNLLISA